jgi:hypothetical protein
MRMVSPSSHKILPVLAIFAIEKSGGCATEQSGDFETEAVRQRRREPS